MSQTLECSPPYISADTLEEILEIAIQKNFRCESYVLNYLMRLDLFGAYWIHQKTMSGWRRTLYFGLDINMAKVDIYLMIPKHIPNPKNTEEKKLFMKNMKILLGILKSYDL